MAGIHPLAINIDCEDDGRLPASMAEPPGVMAYGETEEKAIRKVKAVALQILADMIESGEEVPESLKVLFAREPLARSKGPGGSTLPFCGSVGL